MVGGKIKFGCCGEMPALLGHRISAAVQGGIPAVGNTA